MTSVIRKMRDCTNVLRSLGGINGMPQEMLLKMHAGLITSRPTYALPLVKLSATKLASIEQVNRVALRVCLGIPRCASSEKTLVEARANTITNEMLRRCLGHLIRMENERSTGSLIMRIAERTHSSLAHSLALLGDVAGTAEPLRELPPLHHDPHPLDVDLHIPGIRSRKKAATVTLRQLAESHIEERCAGCTRVYTDGSVRPTDGSSTAAVVFVAEGDGVRVTTSNSARLGHHATSTTTELAAILLALQGIQRDGGAMGSWAILSDSQAAIAMLDGLARAPPLARRIAAEAAALMRRGHKIKFQWLPSHCGIRGNEEADRLADAAHDDPNTPASSVLPSADAKLLVARSVAALHPDSRKASGDHPAPLPSRMDRATAAVYHRIRTGSATTPAWINRMRPAWDAACGTCGVKADDTHLLMDCSVYEEERRTLHDRFHLLGLPSTNMDEVLRPRGSACKKKQALQALIEFIEDTGLLESL